MPLWIFLQRLVSVPIRAPSDSRREVPTITWSHPAFVKYRLSLSGVFGQQTDARPYLGDRRTLPPSALPIRHPPPLPTPTPDLLPRGPFGIVPCLSLHSSALSAEVFELPVLGFIAALSLNFCKIYLHRRIVEGKFLQE